MIKQKALESILSIALVGEYEEAGFSSDGIKLIWPKYNSVEEEEKEKEMWKAPWAHNWNDYPEETAVWLMDLWVEFDNVYDEELVRWYEKKKNEMESRITAVDRASLKECVSGDGPTRWKHTLELYKISKDRLVKESLHNTPSTSI